MTAAFSIWSPVFLAEGRGPDKARRAAVWRHPHRPRGAGAGRVAAQQPATGARPFNPNGLGWFWRPLFHFYPVFLPSLRAQRRRAVNHDRRIGPRESICHDTGMVGLWLSPASTERTLGTGVVNDPDLGHLTCAGRPWRTGNETGICPWHGTGTTMFAHDARKCGTATGLAAVMMTAPNAGREVSLPFSART